MPRVLRILLAIIAFTIFFVGSLLIGAVFFPFVFFLSLGQSATYKDRCTRFVGRGYGTFLYCLRVWGLIDWKRDERLAVPAELEGKPYVIVANHPTLIDVLFLLHWLPGTTSVVKSAWRNNVFFALILRSVHYISNGERGDDPFTGALERMVTHVREGHPLIIFPEGTRSLATKMHRFKRGAFEVAIRTGVPILPIFIGVDPPILMKGASLDLHARGQYHFEMLPVVETEGWSDAKLLRDAVESDFRARFESWVAATGRLEASVPKVSAPEGLADAVMQREADKVAAKEA